MLVVKIKKTGPTAGLTRKELANAARETYRAMGVLWHDQMRPRHFTHEGARIYNYVAREAGENQSFGRSYTGQKLRKYGHTKPLVKTGVSEKLAKIRDVRPTSKGARVVLHARGLNRKNPKSLIDMRAEVTTVLPREGETLADHGEREFQRQINQIRRTETHTTKS